MHEFRALSSQQESVSARLGARLRQRRKRLYPKDTMADFAARIQVSRATLQKMERGDPSVSLESYLNAASILGCADRVADWFADEKPGRNLLEGLEL